MRRSIIMLAFLVCSGCVSDSLPPAERTDEFRGDYVRLANCYYEAESAKSMTGLKLNELRATKTIIVAREIGDLTGGSMPTTEVRFSEASPGRTSVQIRVFRSVWGSDADRAPILSRIRSCAGSA